mmetsp:Transcript_12307/g.29033  ORF Transcript_12307/g.29033 Transcript_12307/m.29033 type:complete len:456 (+) Transcript_12307:415-1782(+)
MHRHAADRGGVEADRAPPRGKHRVWRAPCPLLPPARLALVGAGEVPHAHVPVVAAAHADATLHVQCQHRVAVAGHALEEAAGEDFEEANAAVEGAGEHVGSGQPHCRQRALVLPDHLQAEPCERAPHAHKLVVGPRGDHVALGGETRDRAVVPAEGERRGSVEVRVPHPHIPVPPAADDAAGAGAHGEAEDSAAVALEHAHARARRGVPLDNFLVRAARVHEALAVGDHAEHGERVLLEMRNGSARLEVPQDDQLVLAAADRHPAHDAAAQHFALVPDQRSALVSLLAQPWRREVPHSELVVVCAAHEHLVAERHAVDRLAVPDQPRHAVPPVRPIVLNDFLLDEVLAPASRHNSRASKPRGNVQPHPQPFILPNLPPTPANRQHSPQSIRSQVSEDQETEIFPHEDVVKRSDRQFFAREYSSGGELCDFRCAACCQLCTPSSSPERLSLCSEIR